jgi:uncharacterized protein (DUF1330 family)
VLPSGLRPSRDFKLKPSRRSITSEIDVRDVDAWQKDYAPKAQAVIKAAGGRVLAAGQKVTVIEGAPPKPRVAIIQWESAEQVQAWVNSAARKELMPQRDKLGTVRAFTVEGLPQ